MPSLIFGSAGDAGAITVYIESIVILSITMDVTRSGRRIARNRQLYTFEEFAAYSQPRGKGSRGELCDRTAQDAPRKSTKRLKNDTCDKCA